jgi:hypothetical protein
LLEPSEPTILEVLNCGFSQTKGEKEKFQAEEKNNENSTIQATELNSRTLSPAGI